jgi:hypothetical protein
LTVQDSKLLTIGTLALYYRMRQAESALYLVVTLPTSGPIPTDILAEGTTYHKLTSGNTGHGHGPPGPWMCARAGATLYAQLAEDHADKINVTSFLALLGGGKPPITHLSPEVAEFAEEAATKGFSTADIVIRLNARRAAESRALLAQEIQVFRGKVCKDKSKYNLTMATRSTSAVINAFVKALCTYATMHGGMLHYGMAPPSHTERQLQVLLKKLESQLS